LDDHERPAGIGVVVVIGKTVRVGNVSFTLTESDAKFRGAVRDRKPGNLLLPMSHLKWNRRYACACSNCDYETAEFTKRIGETLPGEIEADMSRHAETHSA
jgi:hypothetical protein